MVITGGPLMLILMATGRLAKAVIGRGEKGEIERIITVMLRMALGAVAARQIRIAIYPDGRAAMLACFIRARIGPGHSA
jgi:hypothetical protein